MVAVIECRPSTEGLQSLFWNMGYTGKLVIKIFTCHIYVNCLPGLKSDLNKCWLATMAIYRRSSPMSAQPSMGGKFVDLDASSQRNRTVTPFRFFVAKHPLDSAGSKKIISRGAYESKNQTTRQQRAREKRTASDLANLEGFADCGRSGHQN
ncbi:hypothetical protein K435DRAFT_799783 [Dendrothele bispora CBS 962.96]|uniref:Uncharacterized protein n=1 Tax=Dendrothele bispora (strain CBS 962.96) TaxID=1314807 RepID=A0A4S8LVI6_DENBC|nr:hypothetical protein K435DRAFT_799783 [Dendrothele bispora CBS 962.96]